MSSTGLKTLCDWCNRDLRVVAVTQQIDFNGSLGKMLAAVLFGVPSVSFGATAVVDFESVQLPSDGGPALVAFSSDSTIGWSFTPHVDIRVTDLGFVDRGIGLSMLHAVGVWDSTGQLLSSTELGGNAPSGRIIPPNGEAPPWPRQHEGDYLFAPIVPLQLRAGETYIVGATVPLFSPESPTVEGWQIRADSYPLAVAPGSLIVNPGIEIRKPALLWRGVLGPDQIFGPGVLHFPNVSIDNGTFAGVNFNFTVVPEPSTGILAFGTLLGVWASRRVARRHQHTGGSVPQLTQTTTQVV